MNTINWDSIGHLLTALLIISIFYETALSSIFNWRLFQTVLKDKGAKTPVTIAVAFAVFWHYDLDLFTELLKALGYPQESNLGGKIITALIIAGGSGGVNGLFERLNIRKPKQLQTSVKNKREILGAAKKILLEEKQRKETKDQSTT